MQSPNFNFTLKKFEEILGENKEYEEWYNILNELFPAFEISNAERIASFLSQTIYESNYYKNLEENLNYSAERLLEVFPKYFKCNTEALIYENEPEEIANKVYANRMGNGNEESGDGWKFRGRGIIQITGKNNYKELNDYFVGCSDINILHNPDLLSKDKKVAACTACVFWYKHELNSLADTKSIKSITKIINGGFNGLNERQLLYDMIYNILNGKGETC